MVDFKNEVTSIGKNARNAARKLAVASNEQKSNCLLGIAEILNDRQDEIVEANKIDLRNGKLSGLNKAMLDRLELTPQRFESMVRGLKDVAALSDPVGKIDREFTLPNKLLIKKVRVPIGVIGIIYESRPNVTVDAAGICLKAGNAVILRGGKEAIHSNKALASCMTAGIGNCNMDPLSIQIIPWTDREAVRHLLKLNDYLDLVIPRGGEGLIRFVAENATVPVIKHYKGVCQIYIDKIVDEDMALSIVDNAKCQRPGVCNAVETVLIHEDIAASFSPRLAECLGKRGVEIRGDSKFCRLVSSARKASEEDWYEEYLDKILAVRIVPGIDQAIAHINHYGSAHSDAIISSDSDACNRFLSEVDSATVYVNASTRFTDGGQFGMGAEIGISTDRIHARGPMGLEELTSYKYQIIGNGQIRT